MPTFILMTQAQANQVRGLTSLGHACAPVPTQGVSPQMFVLPISVLDDPAHASIRSLLQSFTQITVASVTRTTDNVLNAACTYDKRTWALGQKIIV